jgi:hypothetical protein
VYVSNRAARDAWYRERFGNEFNGQNQYVLMAGRMPDDPYYETELDVDNELALKYARHPTSPHAVEKGLHCLLDLANQTYLALPDPYNVHGRIVAVLLKLYREDDAVGVIRYWLDWRSRGPNVEQPRNQHVIQNYKHSSSPWPFPIIKDARYLDDIVDRLSNFPEQEAHASVPIEFALVVLVIKMRFITVYRKRAEMETLYLHFLNSKVLGLKMLGNDLKPHVLSFLVEGGRGCFFTQINHVNRLMDYLDQRDATLLPALVNPDVRTNRNSDQICFETFLDDYANGTPVIQTIKSMLTARYHHNIMEPTPASSRTRTKRSAEEASLDPENHRRPRQY